MNTTKEQQLRELVKTALVDNHTTEEVKQVLVKLNISEKELEDAFVKYDLDIFGFENEIYESLAMRAVLYLKYQMRNSWHFARQQTVLEQVKQCSPTSIVDMGFGVPSLYVKEYVLQNKEIDLTLVDLFESAFTFSEALLEILDSEWKKQVQFKKLDMNTHEYPGNFDLYIFQDSIEHVKDATKYLQKMVTNSPEGASFIFSLPIGPIIPIHTISWDTTKEARTWLEVANLRVVDEKGVYLNPEGDLWAEQLENNFFNWMVLCQKV